MIRSFARLVLAPMLAAGIVALGVGLPILAVGEASDEEVRARAGAQMFQAGSGAAERAMLQIERRLTAVRSGLVTVAAGDLRKAVTDGSEDDLFDATVTAAFAAGPGRGLIEATRVSLTDPQGDLLVELDGDLLAAMSRNATPGAFLTQAQQQRLAGQGFAAPESGAFKGRSDPVARELLARPADRYVQRLLLPAVVSEAFQTTVGVLAKTVIALGTPVFSADGSRRVDAMLVVEYPIDALREEISSLPEELDDLYVIDRSGRFLMSTRPQTASSLTDLTANVVVRKVVGEQPVLAGVVPRPTVLEFGPDPLTAEERPFASAVMREIGWYALAVPRRTLLADAEAVISRLRATRVSIVLVLIVAAFGLTTFVREVTRQRAQLAATNRALVDARDRLESASRHKSEFLSNMSHELRTPLNAIIGFADVLGQRFAGDMNAKQSEYVSDIAGSGHHLLDLVNEILDLAKVEAGRMELETSEFDPTESIQSTLALVRERAAGHGIQIATEVPSDLGAVLADERKFRQILLNLLSNAVKFTPDGGWVGVVVRREGDELHISVRDTGVGISSGDQARVFDEFQQVGRDPERSREGTGLGLTLAKRFVELHGGRIWVESEIGKGSTFTFAIPVRQTALAGAKG